MGRIEQESGKEPLWRCIGVCRGRLQRQRQRQRLWLRQCGSGQWTAGGGQGAAARPLRKVPAGLRAGYSSQACQAGRLGGPPAGRLGGVSAAAALRRPVWTVRRGRKWRKPRESERNLCWAIVELGGAAGARVASRFQHKLAHSETRGKAWPSTRAGSLRVSIRINRAAREQNVVMDRGSRRRKAKGREQKREQ